jgi:hypothetical protein
MDRPDLYDSDILAWSEQQAAALRRLSLRRDLPNDLDLDNVVEEIESVGLSQLHRVESLIVKVLAHVAKAVSDAKSPSIGHWRTECVAWHGSLERAFAPSMRQRIDMDGLWVSALKQAAAALEEHGAQLRAGLAGPCPVTLDDLLSDTFEFRDIVQQVDASLS